jgi:acyl-CoA synthetase (NDP forming)
MEGRDTEPRRPARDVTGRPLELRDLDLDTFLHPRSVVVIGASEAPGKPNAAMTRRLKRWADDHDATFHPVHPVHEQVLGVACVRSIDDVPGDIDLAAILTSKAVDAFAEVIARKARFAVVFAAGYSEAGAAGAAEEQRLRELAASGDTHLLGPNTNLNAFEEFRTDLDGPSIALVTQSGHQGRPVFQGQELGIRVSHWAPTGNEVDLEVADFLSYFADQAEVGVVAAYVEGFKDGRTLMLAADHAARLQKPLVVVKVGRTDEGAARAKAHTGHLTGRDAVISAVFRQFGVTRVDGLDELLETSAALARTRPAEPPKWGGRGPGVCVYAISGGTGAHMADLVAAAGLRLPGLSAGTRTALHDGLIPEYLRVSNPVDSGGPPVADARGRRILDLIVADPAIDVLVVPITGAVDIFSEPFTRDLVDVARTTTKPIFVVWGSPSASDDTYYRRLLDGGLPVFRTFGNCVGAIRAYVDYWQFAARYRSPFPSSPRRPSSKAARARRILGAAPPGGALAEHDAKALLRAYGIRTTRDTLCTSATEAVRAAAKLAGARGRPVVMKASSPDLLHKSDLGLVRVGVTGATEVRTTFTELQRKAERAAGRAGRVDGVLVCEQIDDGVEMVLGVSQDDLFGPVVMVGSGGILVELLGDVTFRVPPFDRREADRMLHELAGRKLLDGVRGSAPADRPALVGAAMKVQQLATDLSCPDYAERLGELDVNPLVVRPRGAVALDALVVRSSE